MVSTKASVYNYESNDVDGDFGTNKTKSGIDISPTEFTAAVAMPTYKGSPTPNYNGHQIGDVLMVRNNSVPNSPAILVLATDVGSLPNAQIDLVDGIASQSLGMETIYSEKTGRAIGVSNSEDVTVTKIGSVKTDGDRRQNYREAMATIKDINVNGKPISDLEPLLKAKEGEIDFSQTVQSLAPTIKQDQLRKSPDRDFQLQDPNDEFYQPENTRRKKQDVDNWLQTLPPEDRAFFTVIMALVAFISGDAEKGNALLSGVTEGHSYGRGLLHESFDSEQGVRSGATQKYSYNGKGEIGGASKAYDYKLPEFAAVLVNNKAEPKESAGEYFGRSAKSFVGQAEVGKNGGAFVDWTMERAGLAGTHNPWCAGFTSKMYEGTGLFNYTASALNIMEQASGTGSFKGGTKNLNGVEVGDAMVFDRGTSTDYKGHVGIVTGVEKDASGNVVKVITAEGNKGDKVKECVYTPDSLKENRYFGFADISHRAEKLGINLEEKLLQSTPEYRLAQQKAKETEVAESKQPPVDQAALDEAKKLSVGLELKDPKVNPNDWPPGVDKSIVDAMVAAKANNIG